MKIVIFAGGSGKRFWPLSRENFPKQFQPIIENKSTVELVTAALEQNYKWHDIYFATTEKLVALIKNYFPKLPTQNIITEPVRRDVGPAVGLAMTKLAKIGAGDEPVAVLWGDSFAMNSERFLQVLALGEKKLRENPKQLVWLGQKPQFANENVGWIELGDRLGSENGLNYYRRAGFKYRPSLEKAQEWLKDGKHIWNTGYFVTSANFILDKYHHANPELAGILAKIGAGLNTEHEAQTIEEEYPKLPAIHFDNIVLDNLTPEETEIIESDFGWSDPGTLYALKQFLQEKDDDVVSKGLVHTHNTRDSLVYNYVNKQLVSTVGLDGMVVVNTPDVLLIVPKDKIGDIKDMLGDFKDSELEKYL